MPVFFSNAVAFDLDVVARLAESEGVSLPEAEAMLKAAIPNDEEAE